VNIPWQSAKPVAAAECAAARAWFGLRPDQQVALYAGNLDAYQGLEAVSEAMAKLVRARPELVWLIATQSPSREFSRRLERAGLKGHIRFASLADECDRRRAHAASDLALVPRAAAGGIPIKLLEALVRGLPVVANRTACAGLALPPDAVALVEESGGWDVAIDHVLRGMGPAPERGRAFIAQAHDGTRFVSDLIAHAQRWQLLSTAGA
jgi:glycosyltransferase involved in cell wall biosynthesis